MTGIVRSLALRMQGRIGRGMALAIMAVALSACSGDNIDDLRQYVEQTKTKPGGRIDPLPEVKPFESFTYAVAARRSPFEPWPVTGTGPSTGVAGSGSGIQPDANRRREALEGFPLDTLRMVGALEQRGKIWAVIKAPDGLVYRAALQNYIGQNHGRIIAVSEEKVELVEIVPDGLGGWQERPARLALAE